MTITNNQFDKAETFRALHARPIPFVIANPWDIGSAKMLTTIGYDALATTSAGFAYSIGKTDGTRSVTRDEALENARAIADATHLPVSVDLENGYGDSPATCAETILLAAKTGIVGGSIEDATGRTKDPIYDFDVAVARVRAAVEAARTLPFYFTVTARAENFLHGRFDLDDSIARLQAFAAAGADVLFAPGVTTREEIREIVQSVAPFPVNVLCGLSGPALSVNELAKLGVRRISVGSSLARAAFKSFYSAATEIKQKGTFYYVSDAMTYKEMNLLF